METQGKPFPLIDNQTAVNLDVWMVTDGVGFSLSDGNGHIVAACIITEDQWKDIRHYVERAIQKKQWGY